MTSLAIGIVREEKKPADRRIPFTPDQLSSITKNFPFKVVCQPSKIRCFNDEEFIKKGLVVQENLEDCEVIFGVKEVPVEHLLAGKIYFMFSHTIKKQAYNQKLLKTILDKKIRLIDYECLTDVKGQRLVAFGYWAGIVGAYNALWTSGKKYGRFSLKRANDCFDLAELKIELAKAILPPIKIVLTGNGRVASGAAELLKWAGIRQVDPKAYLNEDFDIAVFTQLDVGQYVTHQKGHDFDFGHFVAHPSDYVSTFAPYAASSDVLISAAFWDPKSPRLFEKEEVMDDDFKIKIIADITCDIDGSVPTTIRASTIDSPVYDFSTQFLEERRPFSDPANITVMAIDNLPSELPRNASESFGDQLMSHVIPALAKDINSDLLTRATIAQNGKLMPSFEYLSDYAFGTKIE